MNRSTEGSTPKKIDTRKLTGMALFVALEVALCFITNYVQFSTFNINLALIPIAIGACFYGPWLGLVLGIINGVITIFAPATMALIAVSSTSIVAATIFLCVFKTAMAGMVAGFISKAFSRKLDLVGAILASVAVPVVNTGLFILGAYIFFYDMYMEMNTEGVNLFVFLITLVIGLNFLIEVVSNVVIDPVLYKVLEKVNKKGRS